MNRKYKINDLIKVTLEEERKIQINMLNAINEFCDSFGIKYYLMYGTLLGAIRHKGFIPWDDDIDIGMFRKDYNLFFEYFNQSCQKDFVAINIDTNKKYYLPMGKVIDTRTILYEEVNVKFPLGVFIDVFPIDYLPDSEDKCMKIINRISFYEKLLAYKQAFLSKRYSLIKNIFHIGMKMILFPFTNNRICKQINKIAVKYQKKDSNYIGSIVLGVYGKNEVWNLQDFNKTDTKEFEGKKYPVPYGWDNLLCKIYGEYMVLPSIEKQVSHHKNNAYWRK